MGLNGKQYDGPPSVFVNLKRIKLGEQDSKGKDKYAFTFGLTKDKDGNEVNTCDQLIDALTELRGKQVNLTFHVGEAESKGRTFPTGYVRVTEMIPRDAETTTVYVPKQSKSQTTQAKSEAIRNKFNQG